MCFWTETWRIKSVFSKQESKVNFRVKMESTEFFGSETQNLTLFCKNLFSGIYSCFLKLLNNNSFVN